MGHGLHRRAEGLRTFLSYGFRPFFLAAAGWSAIAIALWIATLTFPYRRCHRHHDPRSDDQSDTRAHGA